MKHATNDPKLTAILDSAWTAFSTYGFRKTSMDDIARGASMSRPALYLRFKNKEDIYRSLVTHFFDESERLVGAALSEPGAPQNVLERAMFAQSASFVEAMLSSPHGGELADANTSVAADIAERGEARLTELYADWLRSQGVSGGQIAWTPEQIASTLTIALKGIKMSATDQSTFEMQVKCLAESICFGIFRK
jgi:AcrR family transcriptional regulator